MKNRIAAIAGLGAAVSARAHGVHGPGGHEGWDLDHFAHGVAHWAADGLIVLGLLLAFGYGWRKLRGARRDRLRAPPIHRNPKS